MQLQWNQPSPVLCSFTLIQDKLQMVLFFSSLRFKLFVARTRNIPSPLTFTLNVTWCIVEVVLGIFIFAIFFPQIFISANIHIRSASKLWNSSTVETLFTETLKVTIYCLVCKEVSN